MGVYVLTNPRLEYKKKSWKHARRHRLYVWYENQYNKTCTPPMYELWRKDTIEYCEANFGPAGNGNPMRWLLKSEFSYNWVEFRDEKDAMLMKLAFGFPNSQILSDYG